MAYAISFGDGINGIVEAGISAGSDVFSDSRWGVTVRYDLIETEPDVAAAVAALPELKDKDKRLAALEALDPSLKTAVGEAAKGAGGYSTLCSGGAAKFKALVAAKCPRGAPVKKINTGATLCGMDVSSMDAEVSKLYQSMIAFVCENGWVKLDLSDTVHSVQPTSAIVKDSLPRKPADVDKLGFFDWQSIATLLVATKVNFWKLNHHVGTDPGGAVAYVGKVLQANKLVDPSNNKEARNAIWAASKLLPTRVFLGNFGVPNLENEHFVVGGRDEQIFGKISIKMTDDIALRLKSNPAGTAASATYHQIAKRAAMSPFGIFVPNLPNYTPVQAGLKEVAGDPARYHMGSYFLTGKDRIVAPSYEEEEREALAGFIHAVAPSSKLGEAKVILPIAEVKGNVTYMGIMGIKTELLSAGAQLVTKELVLSKMGGDSTGGFALQAGFVKLEDVEAAKRSAKEKEDAAKAEAAAKAKA